MGKLEREQPPPGIPNRIQRDTLGPYQALVTGNLRIFLCFCNIRIPIEATQRGPERFDFILIINIENPLFWVNYNELTTSSLEIIVSKGNHPQMALIQVSELL